MESSITPIGMGEVLLHVGLHKTGTTALQVALADARGVLEDYHVRYPGKGLYHHKAILAGADRPYGWRDNGARITPKNHWKKMLKEAQYEGRTIISSEFLDDIKPEIGARVVDDLGGTGRVSVVVTLRAIGAILPSAWQQGLKAVAGGWPSRRATTAAQRVRTGARFTRMGRWVMPASCPVRGAPGPRRQGIRHCLRR